MTHVKLDSKLVKDVNARLAPFAHQLYTNLGMHLVAVVELKASRRDQPAVDEDVEPAIKVRISSIEIPTGKHEDQVREVMQALYRLRTKEGTLDEVLRDEQTVEHAADVLTFTRDEDDDE